MPKHGPVGEPIVFQIWCRLNVNLMPLENYHTILRAPQLGQIFVVAHNHTPQNRG